MRHLRNIFNLGIKELRSLLGDKAVSYTHLGHERGALSVTFAARAK